jgi:fumarylacetoacetate (FAA) hydrolase
MKLATLRADDVRNRDGRLAVVSKDLTRMLSAESVAPTLQAALDDWARLEGPLRALAARVD